MRLYTRVIWAIIFKGTLALKQNCSINYSSTVNDKFYSLFLFHSRLSCFSYLTLYFDLGPATLAFSYIPGLQAYTLHVSCCFQCFVYFSKEEFLSWFFIHLLLNFSVLNKAVDKWAKRTPDSK